MQLPLPDKQLDEVETALRSIADYRSRICEAVARAVDDVVDPVRSARWQIGQLSQPEKTVIGIRVENVIRMELGLERAHRLDIVVAGQNVDIKFTIGSNWSIPQEAHEEICLVAKFDERNLLVSAGLVRATVSHLNPGRNRDTKAGLNSKGMQSIRWLVESERPDTSVIGFMAEVDAPTRAALTDPTVGAQERVNRLFLKFIGQPISEEVVQAIAQHFDWTRRLRPDARNRKAPERRGYEVLRSSSPSDRRKLTEAGQPPLQPGYCMSVAAQP